MQRKILLVDDEIDDVQPLQEPLQKEGYQVLFAQSGQEALKVIEAERPDFIICDLEMPGMRGQDVLEAVSTNPELDRIPFFLVNEVWTIDNWSRPTSNGRTADCHLSKLIIPNEVIAFAKRIFRVMDENEAAERTEGL